MRLTTLLTVPLAVGMVIGASSASVADPGPTNFGQHVSSCAQTMGFTADHNPGVHQGASGWDGMPC
jgi:hypothetical protein